MRERSQSHDETMRASPSAGRHRSGWYAAGLAFSLLMLCVHAAAGLHTAGVPDFWRDNYWAAKIAHGEAFPLSGPPIYGLFDLGPWWFYLLALPIGFSGGVTATAVFIQLLAGSKYLLAWRLGMRVVDDRFGFVFAMSLAIAGWSTIPLMFPSHTALVETTLLLLAMATWRCWQRLSIGNAILFGLAAGACLHAHPTTASYIVMAGFALLARHRERALMPLAIAALIVLALLAPPWLDHARGIGDRSIETYVAGDVGVRAWQRIPLLVASALAGGAWNGFLLMTPWNLDHVRVAWIVYCACLVFAGAGLFVLPKATRLRAAAVAAACVFLAQILFLAALRPITPMWMFSSALPPLAFVIALGWYGWLVGERTPRRVALCALALFTALSLAPFGLFFRAIESLRVAPGANPYYDVIDSSRNYATTAVPYFSARGLDKIAPSLCGESVLHARLAWAVERSLGTPVRLACGHWPTLRYGGREGPPQHIAVVFARASIASGIAPDKVVAGMAMYEHVVPIAPAEGGRPTTLARGQIHPDHSSMAPQRFAIEFDAHGADVPVLTNRVGMPVDVRSVIADGRAARVISDDGGSRLYACAACERSADVHWRFELDGVEDDIDLVVLDGVHVAGDSKASPDAR